MVCRAMVAAVTAEDYREELRDASRVNATTKPIPKRFLPKLSRVAVLAHAPAHPPRAAH